MGKTVILNEENHDKLKTYCKAHKVKLNEILNKIISDYLEFELREKSKLPLIMKDSNGDIIETIICNDISTDYVNNMPKELTLMRNTLKNSGYIANYKKV